MNKPIAAGAQFPLPPADTGDRLCVTLSIPSDEISIANFIGALMMLARWNNYLPDPSGARKNKPTADIWRDIVMGIAFEDCAGNDVPVAISEMDYDMSICEQLRWNDGVLEGYCCGEWVPIDGNPGPAGGSGQPGGGGTPDPGQCTSYHVQFEAKNQALVPAIVSTGDTVTFTNAQGAANDGTIAASWRCPDGQLFFAGACIGDQYHDGSDPDTADFHMQLVAQIGGAWYPASSGTITIPSGVSNAQIVIQANDSDTSDNSGSYALDVEVCNNAAVPWSHTFDLAIDPGPWSVTASECGEYVPGVGFRSTHNAGLCVNDDLISIETTLPTATGLTFASWTTYQVCAIAPTYANFTAGATTHSPTLPSGASNYLYTTSIAAGSHLQIDLLQRPYTGTGQFVINKIVITGYGSDPF